MELMSIGKFAEKAGISTSTLRNMDKENTFKPCRVSIGGTRYYSTEQLRAFQNVNDSKTKIVLGYCRVSTPSQKDDLETQVTNLKTYMFVKGYQFNIIRDIGSGINYKKKGLKQLIDMINNREVSKIVILYKDRLVRFGFELIEYLCEINGVEIEVVGHEEKSLENELTEDLIQIITVFANRLYGSRSKKTKRLIDEVKNNVDRDKDTIKTD